MRNPKRQTKTVGQLIIHGAIIIILGITTVSLSTKAQTQSEVSTYIEAIASTADVDENVKVEISSTEVHNEVEEVEQPVIEMEMYPQFTYDKEWTEEERYMLAKIAMAEAEGENIQTKTLVILTVLNRVQSDEFPDTIEEVIHQKRTTNGKTVYQFSPVIPGGRWYTTEPNEDCWEALQVVEEALYDYSGGATYFESCKDEDNWHSRNLEFLYQSENMRFYK